MKTTKTLHELMVAQREAEAHARLASDGLLPGLALAIAFAGIAVTTQRDAADWVIPVLYYLGAFILLGIVLVLMIRSRSRHEAAVSAQLAVEGARAAAASERTAEALRRQQIDLSHRVITVATVVAAAALVFGAGRRG